MLRKSHPRARRLRLTVTSGGARLTYPEGTHPAQVFAFLRKHGEWLERKLDELSLGSSPPALKPGAATVIPLRGETTRLSWRDGAYPHIEQIGDRLVLTLAASARQGDAAGRARAAALVSRSADPPRRQPLSRAVLSRARPRADRGEAASAEESSGAASTRAIA